jgi:N-methylhydantoinase A
VLHVRVRAVGRTDRPQLAQRPLGDGDAGRALRGHRDAYDFSRREVASFAVYDRATLAPGDRFTGPALVDEGTATTVVVGGQRVSVDRYGHLLIGEDA